jgi:perosamine synthetase
MKRIVKVGAFVLGNEEENAIKDVMNEWKNGGRLCDGKKQNEFEKEFAKYIGTKHSIVTSSGTTALITGLTALRHFRKEVKKENKKIITTPLTYIATTNTIVVTGYEPIFVDIDPDTFVITPENIKKALEDLEISDVSAILPVHLLGYPCKMDEINKIGEKHNISIIEDACESHGTVYKGKKTGSMSLFAPFSFYIAHNIQAGQMGCLTTSNDEMRRLMFKIKNQGRACDCMICKRNQGLCPKINLSMDPRFTHEIIGFNFGVMEFAPALALAQLKHVEKNLKKRRENVKYLNEGLEKFSDEIKIPIYDKNVSYLAYPLITKNIERLKLRKRLENFGIETRPLFGNIPLQQPVYKHLRKKYTGKLPNTSHIAKNAFYIGAHQYLTREDLDHIIKAFEKIFRN